LVREGSRLLDAGQGDDLRWFEHITGDREVLDGPLGLRGVQRVLGHAHLAHGVVFDAVLGVGHGDSFGSRYGRDRGEKGTDEDGCQVLMSTPSATIGTTAPSASR